MNIHGILKPTYRAYEIVNGLGDERLEVKGKHETVFVWAARSGDAVQLVVVNLALPGHDIEAQTVEIALLGLPEVAAARLRRIDGGDANAKAQWKMRGEPSYPTPAEVEAMIDASRMQVEQIQPERNVTVLRLSTDVQSQSVTGVESLLKGDDLGRPTAPESQIRSVFAFASEDEASIDGLQSAASRYFTEYVNPLNGLVADNTRTNSACSIASVGFALSCYPVAVERGWLGRAAAAELSLTTLSLFPKAGKAVRRARRPQGSLLSFLGHEIGPSNL